MSEHFGKQFVCRRGNDTPSSFANETDVHDGQCIQLSTCEVGMNRSEGVLTSGLCKCPHLW